MIEEQKEKRGVYNVQFNGKKSTGISKDIKIVYRAIKFEQGFEDPKKNTGKGAVHIKNLGNDKNGWISTQELLIMGDVVRSVEPEIKTKVKKGKKTVKHIYTFYGDDRIRFRLVIGKNSKKGNVISYYSNREAGLENNTLTYFTPTSSKSMFNADGRSSPIIQEVRNTSTSTQKGLNHLKSDEVQSLSEFSGLHTNKDLEYRYSDSLQQGKGSPMSSQTRPTPKNEATNNTVNN